MESGTGKRSTGVRMGVMGYVILPLLWTISTAQQYTCMRARARMRKSACGDMRACLCLGVRACACACARGWEGGGWVGGHVHAQVADLEDGLDGTVESEAQA